jgi:hypothetical protein
MGYQPWYATQTYPAWQIPLNVESTPDTITGLTATAFTMIFHEPGVADTVGTGTFAIVTASPAIVTYTPSAADVANVFNGELIVKAAFAAGSIAVYDPIPFVVTAI